MRQKSGPDKAPAEQVPKEIRRQTPRLYPAEEKIRIVLERLRGEESISELCRREGVAASICYGWSKEFLEAGKRRLAGDTARALRPRMRSRACAVTLNNLTPADIKFGRLKRSSPSASASSAKRSNTDTCSIAGKPLEP